MAKTSWIKKSPFKGQTAVICGGSKGIGRAVALEIAQLGGSVLLVARGQEALQEAAQAAKKVRANGDQFVDWAACDATDMEALKPILDGFVTQHGVPDHLINNVGYAYPEYVENLTLEDYQRNLSTNYYGQLVPTLVMLPHFMAARRGHITFTSSMMGYFGIMGYATYAPTKFAIVGLVEVLRHELKPHGLTFSISFPPDTDTPGFEIENQTKPPECAMLSENAKLMTSEQVAEATIGGLMKKKLYIMPGEAGWIWRLFRFFPGLVRWIVDNDYAKARKKLGKV
jgi:3-dehydrosphinganine reductase